MCRACRDFSCKCDSAAVLTAVRAPQAVLREAEAVAHCHRVQVGAKREQVRMTANLAYAILLNKQTSQMQCDSRAFFFFYSLFAALSTTRVFHYSRLASRRSFKCLKRQRT